MIYETQLLNVLAKRLLYSGFAIVGECICTAGHIL